MRNRRPIVRDLIDFDSCSKVIEEEEHGSRRTSTSSSSSSHYSEEALRLSIAEPTQLARVLQCSVVVAANGFMAFWTYSVLRTRQRMGASPAMGRMLLVSLPFWAVCIRLFYLQFSPSGTSAYHQDADKSDLKY